MSDATATAIGMLSEATTLPVCPFSYPCAATRYLIVGQGSGVVGPGDSGAYVALVPPVGPSAGFSLVLETVGKAGGNLTVQLTGGLPGPGTTLHVWQTTEVSGLECHASS